MRRLLWTRPKVSVSWLVMLLRTEPESEGPLFCSLALRAHSLLPIHERTVIVRQPLLLPRLQRHHPDHLARRVDVRQRALARHDARPLGGAQDVAVDTIDDMHLDRLL